MTSVVVSRPDMPGYTSLDMDDVHTPSRYCFHSSVPRRPRLLLHILYAQVLFLLSSSVCLHGRQAFIRSRTATGCNPGFMDRTPGSRTLPLETRITGPLFKGLQNLNQTTCSLRAVSSASQEASPMRHVVPDAGSKITLFNVHLIYRSCCTSKYRSTTNDTLLRRILTVPMIWT